MRGALARGKYATASNLATPAIEYKRNFIDMIKAEHPYLFFSFTFLCVGFLLYAQAMEKPGTVYLIPNSSGSGKMRG